MRQTWDLAEKVLADIQVGADSERSGVHWAHALQFLIAAGVELLVHGSVAIDDELQLGGDLAGDVGNTLDDEAQTAVVGGEGDIEEGCGEAGVGHARVQ